MVCTRVFPLHCVLAGDHAGRPHCPTSSCSGWRRLGSASSSVDQTVVSERERCGPFDPISCNNGGDSFPPQNEKEGGDSVFLPIAGQAKEASSLDAKAWTFEANEKSENSRGTKPVGHGRTQLKRMSSYFKGQLWSSLCRKRHPKNLNLQENAQPKTKKHSEFSHGVGVPTLGREKTGGVKVTV